VFRLIIIASKIPNLKNPLPCGDSDALPRKPNCLRGPDRFDQQKLTDHSRKGRDEEGLGKNWENSDGAGPAKTGPGE
jgi:hypothetical protein